MAPRHRRVRLSPRRLLAWIDRRRLALRGNWADAGDTKLELLTSAPSSHGVTPVEDRSAGKAHTIVKPADQKWRPDPVPSAGTAGFTLELERSFTVCKDLDIPSGNEDLFCWSQDRASALLLDGATESFAAQRWVQLIAAAWTHSGVLDCGEIQAEYGRQIDALELSWAQAQASERGSFTTLLSVAPGEGGLHSTLIGDSAIALCRDEALLEMFPSADPMYFNSTPEALGSPLSQVALNQQLLADCTWTIPLHASPANKVILMTDAVAQWVTSDESDQKTKRLGQMLECADDAAWLTLVCRERAGRRMKVDDSTIAVLKIEEQS